VDQKTSTNTSTGCVAPETVIVHDNPLMCGYYTAAFTILCMGKSSEGVVPTLGETWWERHKPRILLPNDFVQILQKKNIPSHVKQFGDQDFSDSGRLSFLRKQGKPIPILVPGRGYVAPHWIVVCGYDPLKGSFFVYDPRNRFSFREAGTSTSSTTRLPIGNREVPEERLLSMWRCRTIFNPYLKWRYDFESIAFGAIALD